ncbi:MAG: hypothetical protein ABTQ25_17460 [Nitrosomonas ureae]
MTAPIEYVPNPRHAILANELELLNAELIEEGFSDIVRLAVLRHAGRHMLRMSMLFVNRPAVVEEPELDD